MTRSDIPAARLATLQRWTEGLSVLDLAFFAYDLGSGALRRGSIDPDESARLELLGERIQYLTRLRNKGSVPRTVLELEARICVQLERLKGRLDKHMLAQWRHAVVDAEDVRAPTAMGCLLVLVRQAREDPYLTTGRANSGWWAVVTGHNVWLEETASDDETESLVLALEESSV